MPLPTVAGLASKFALAYTRGAQGAQAPQWPGKNRFFVTIEGLSSLKVLILRPKML